MDDDISVAPPPTGRIEQACEYGRSGMRVFPVHADSKNPMPGYGWLALATNKVNEIVEDFDRAIQEWGEDKVSIAWALGIDGYVALDFDVQPEPAWASELEPDAAVNITRRGRHLVFANPEGLTPGNGISGFPEQGWGEVRGAGGYIIVAGPDRPGMDPQAPRHAKRFPFPHWLTAYGGYTNSATKKEVIEFAKAHSTTTGAQWLNWLPVAIDTQWSKANEGDSRFGRHPLACEWAAKAAEESQLGRYAFGDAVKIIKAWWHQVTPPERWGREWDGILSWAVGRALAKQHPPTEVPDEDESLDLAGDNSPFIDWPTFWQGDAIEHEWLVEGFWPTHRSVLLHAPAKTGKSTWTLWCAVQLATGIDLATGEQLGEPREVMYIDYEMTENDLMDALNDFGLSAANDISHLHYSQDPMDFQSLDTAAGAAVALSWVDRVRPDVIIFDTFSRCVDGDENDADTVRAFYRFTGRPLRDRKIAYLRVDHTGKDSTKGARGSSAKNDDVDVIWSMNRTQSGFQLRSKSRVSWVPGVLSIDRAVSANQITFSRSAEISEMVADEMVTAKVYELERLGLDISWGRAKVAEALIAAGLSPGRNEVLSQAIKYRRAAKQRNPSAVFLSPNDGDSPEQA